MNECCVEATTFETDSGSLSKLIGFVDGRIDLDKLALDEKAGQ